MKSLFPLLLLTAATFHCGNAYAAQPSAEQPTASAVAPAPAAGTNSSLNTEHRLDALDDKHKLAVGDKISFRIIEDRDPVVSMIIADSGELEVPYLGRVKSAGKTCKQLAQELKSKLEQEYYYRASVVIGLDAVSKFRGKVYIVGAVRNQGPIDIPTEENFTVAKAIVRAGGFGEFANRQKVKLNRTLPDGSELKEILNMEEIIDKGKTEKDKTIQDGDFIIVPEKTWNF